MKDAENDMQFLVLPVKTKYQDNYSLPLLNFRFEQALQNIVPVNELFITKKTEH